MNIHLNSPPSSGTPSIFSPPLTETTVNTALTRDVVGTISTAEWEQCEVMPFICVRPYATRCIAVNRTVHMHC